MGINTKLQDNYYWLYKMDKMNRFIEWHKQVSLNNKAARPTLKKNEFWLGYDCCPTPLWMVWFDPGMSISIQKASSGSDWSNSMPYGSFPHRQMCSGWPIISYGMDHNQNWPRSPCKAKIFESQCNYGDS